MESYVPMWEKQYLIVCCDSMDGLNFVEHYKTKEQAEMQLQRFYEEEVKKKERDGRAGVTTEIYADNRYLHVSTDNGWDTYNKWMEIVEIQVAI